MNGAARMLTRYDEARAALEACATVDEVRDWVDNAAAMAAYARQLKDKEMRKAAVEIRMRAKRRMGELMALQRAAGGVKVGRPKKNGSTSGPISLAEAGITKRLADESRKAAALLPEAFEQQVAARKAEVDLPDIRGDEPTDTYDPHADVMADAAEALTIINADEHLQAAFAEVLKVKAEAQAIGKLYDALKADVAAHKREATRWMKAAKKAALCKACRVNLERDDES